MFFVEQVRRNLRVLGFFRICSHVHIQCLLMHIGHFIQHCPTNGDPTYDMRKMKPPVGIPKTRLKADQEGSYILPDGSVAVMQPDE